MVLLASSRPEVAWKLLIHYARPLRSPERQRLFLNDFKLKAKLLAAKDVRQVELPKLTRETEGRPMLVQSRNELQTKKAPQLGPARIRINAA